MLRAAGKVLGYLELGPSQVGALEEYSRHLFSKSFSPLVFQELLGAGEMQ